MLFLEEFQEKLLKEYRIYFQQESLKVSQYIFLTGPQKHFIKKNFIIISADISEGIFQGILGNAIGRISRGSFPYILNRFLKFLKRVQKKMHIKNLEEPFAEIFEDILEEILKKSLELFKRNR